MPVSPSFGRVPFAAGNNVGQTLGRGALWAGSSQDPLAKHGIGSIYEQADVGRRPRDKVLDNVLPHESASLPKKSDAPPTSLKVTRMQKETIPGAGGVPVYFRKFGDGPPCAPDFQRRVSTICAAVPPSCPMVDGHR